MSDFYGIPVIARDFIPEDKAFLVNQVLFREEMRLGFALTNPHAQVILLNTETYGRIKPVPLWTRHMLGVREAERDRRRFPR
jgi:hypothetical protein